MGHAFRVEVLEGGGDGDEKALRRGRRETRTLLVAVLNHLHQLIKITAVRRSVSVWYS